jgi:hypothetical protein
MALDFVGYAMHVISRQRRQIETDAECAIDLNVEKRRGDPVRDGVRFRIGLRPDSNNSTRVECDRNGLAGQVMVGVNQHFKRSRFARG